MKRLFLGLLGVSLATCALPDPVAAESPPVFIRAWGSLGTGNGQFDGPISLAVDDGGDIFVCDEGNNGIQKFDSTGK